MDDNFSTFDFRILDQLQKDCSLSSVDLAEKVGLSQSPCWRRLQRLKDEGFIKKQIAILNKSKFAPTIVIFGYLKVSSLTDSKRAEFIRKIGLIPEITECHTVFGERDVMIKVMAQSMDWYQDFVFKTLMKLPGVNDVQSKVMMGELKSTTEIPLKSMQVL